LVSQAALLCAAQRIRYGVKPDSFAALMTGQVMPPPRKKALQPCHGMQG
jgi:hypothetical protein